jgi:hypothetical protein
MIGMVILGRTASLVDRTSVYHSCCTDVLYTNEAVLTSITIPVIQMFCPLGMVILVSTASLVYRTSVQQEWKY